MPFPNWSGGLIDRAKFGLAPGEISVTMPWRNRSGGRASLRPSGRPARKGMASRSESAADCPAARTGKRRRSRQPRHVTPRPVTTRIKFQFVVTLCWLRISHLRKRNLHFLERASISHVSQECSRQLRVQCIGVTRG